MLITAPRSLEDHDPVVLELLNLAAETLLAHESALPAELAALLEAFAGDLMVARGPNANDDASPRGPGTTVTPGSEEQ